jgi:hypothetical protein
MSVVTIPSRFNVTISSAHAPDGPDRRVHDRHAQPPLYVSCLPGGVVDVSVGGICLALGAPVPPQELSELIVTDGLCYTTQTLEAEIVWRSGSRVGLRWVDPTPAEVEWLRECMERWQEDRSAVVANPI